jgi:eukaryotic-like serine/threonine-protein kinase
LGTPSYMAPEQAAGRMRQVGPATDVYGLGAILYECLTGQPPFRGQGRSETLALVCNSEPTPPSRLRPGLSPRLQAICLSCLEKDPAGRYPTAEAVADDLDRWLRGGTPVVRPPGPLARTMGWARRRPVRTVVALLLLLVGGLSLGASLYFRPQKLPEPAPSVEDFLAQGQAVTLLGQRGEPGRIEFAAGRGAKAAASPSGVFSVSAWDQAFLELVKDPRCTHFRLRGEIRHGDGVASSAVGFYACRVAYKAPGGQAHLCAALYFNDASDERQLNDKFRKTLDPKIAPPRPPGNRLMIEPHLYADGLDKPWKPGVAAIRIQYFEPAVGKDKWRPLEMEVTADAIHGAIDDMKGGFLPASTFVEATREYVTTVPTIKPDDFCPCIKPIAFVPRGGVGLYVRNGTAAFRNVVLEPLGN